MLINMPLATASKNLRFTAFENSENFPVSSSFTALKLIDLIELSNSE